MSAETKNAGEDWGDIENVPKQKRGLPRWLMFCGGGCLIALVLGGIAAYVAVQFFKQAKDQDVQYPKLERHIGLDHRLGDYQLFGIEIMGSESYIFGTKKADRMAMILVADTDDERKVFDAQLDPAVTQGMSGGGAREEVEAGTIHVQGRDLRVIRSIQKPITFPGQKSQKGASAFVDITAEGSVDKLYLMYMRPADSTRVSDEEILEFLVPFRVGPQHVESKAPAESEKTGESPTKEEEPGGDH